MSKTNTKAEKLTLRRETLRPLTADQLELVVGGAGPRTRRCSC